MLLCMASSAAAEPENLGIESAKIAAELHRICPRDPASEADVVRALEATGARRPNLSIKLLEASHAAPDDLVPAAALTRSDTHWVYESPDGWVALANIRTTERDGRREIRCKVQMTSDEDHALFAGVLQHAARSVAQERVMADGVKVDVFRIAGSANAYYVLWRDLPPIAPGSAPALVIEYVVRTGPPSPPAVSPEALFLSRLWDYCPAAGPQATAQRVARTPNARANPKVTGVGWIIAGAPEWRLKTRTGKLPTGPAEECSISTYGLHEPELAALLAKAPGFTLRTARNSQDGYVRTYRNPAGEMLLFHAPDGPDDPFKTYTLSLIRGVPLL
ncbi:hypothetical protein DDF67_09150 [Caulobacter endophyticus]|uniref:Uncharacterized protein n=2 Tax=Caulobacter endophyticus TaxID=2172652 RepID=A0A2T9K3N7_9CAUL|nr:hypothetical protein DDF67_09150 [Caulobacter endophyticus]